MLRNIPECLRPFIALKSCDNSDVMTIQDMPHISTKFINAVADEDNPTARQVLDSAIHYALTVFWPDVRKTLLPFTAPLILREQPLCYEARSVADATWSTPSLDAGTSITFNTQGYTRRIDKVRIFSGETGLFLLNIREGANVQQYEVAATANRYRDNILNHKLAGDFDKVDLYFEANTLSLGGWYCDYTQKQWSSGCGCGSSPTTTQTIARTPHATATGYLGGEVSDKVWGIQPVVSIECDREKLLCQFAREFAPALLHLVAAALLQTPDSSTRINATTIKEGTARQIEISRCRKVARECYIAAGETIKEYALQNPSLCLKCTNATQPAYWTP